MVSSSMYDKLAESQKNELDKLQAQRDAMQKGMETAIAEGKIELYSEDWYSMYSEILSVDEAIQDVNSSLIETANSAREADWALFEKSQEMLGAIQKEGDWLIDLMSSEKMFNEDASITSEGQATLGLHSVNYNAYMSQANDYAKKIAEITKDIEADPYNTTLLDKKEEWIEAYRDLISSAEDEKEAIKDLVSEGFDMYLESMNKLIDKRKEWLQTSKDLYDYEKNVAEQTAEVAKLEKQLAVYRRDESEESRANIQKAEEALKDAREALEETEYDRYIQDQEQMLDKMSEDTEEWINERLDNIDGLIQGVIDAINGDSESIKSTLETLLGDVGGSLSSEMESIFSPSDGQSIVSNYDENFDNKNTTVNEVINNLTDFSDALDDYSNATASTIDTAVNEAGKDHVNFEVQSQSTSQQSDDAENVVDNSTSSGELISKFEKVDLSTIPEFKLMEYNMLFSELFKNITGNIQTPPKVQSSQNITVDIGDIIMEGVNDPDAFAAQLKDALQSNKTISNIIQANTLGVALGQNSLSKYKY